MKTYLALDIGGTAIKQALMLEDGRILESRKTDTESGLGGEHILQTVCSIVESFGIPNGVRGVAVSTAGIVDTETGAILHAAPLIPHYAGINYKKTVRERFGLPCEVENDVNCAGYAEYISGAAKGSRSMLMLTVGTGIGGCAIVNGRMLHGNAGAACEIGYMHMHGSDFQTLASTGALLRKVAERKGEAVEAWDGLRVFAEAKKGDPVCVRAIDEMVSVLGEGIANLCFVLNPKVVVLGGGIMEQRDYLRDPIEAAVKSRLIPHIANSTEIRFAKHGNEAGTRGALYHLLDVLGRKNK